MFSLKKANPFSFYALIAIVIYFSISFLSAEGWKANKIMKADRANYYVYLPATFIYHDLHFSYADSLNEVLGDRKVTYFVNEEGKRCQKMSVGVSIMEAPFFLLAHAWASFDSNYEANGYSEVYYFFIILSALFYALFALFLLRKILLRFSSDKTAAFVLLLIAGGTNLYYYSTYIGGISHNPGIFLIAAFIWFTIRWMDTKSINNLIIALFAMGLASIVRPTNVIFGLFLLVYIGESSWSYKGVLEHISTNLGKYTLAILAFLIPVLIQMSLWKYMSGNWIQYSYRDEGFFFTNPKILEGMFSGRNSLIPYAPFLIFAFAGILIPRKKNFPKYSLLLSLSIFIYVIYSWWCWWYGGSIGSRAAIESYIILAIFLAFFIDYLGEKFNPKVILGFLVLLTTFSIYFGHLKAEQYKSVIMHWDSMTYKSYWDIFLNSSRPKNYPDHIKNPDYDNAKTIGEEYVGFKEMTEAEPFSEKSTFNLDAINWNETDSLSIQFRIWGKEKFSTKTIQLIIEIPETDFKESFSIQPYKKERGWNTGSLSVHIPTEFRSQNIDVFYQYTGDYQCYYMTPSLK